MDKSTLAIELQVINFPDLVCWLTQDADGIWWGYEVEPLDILAVGMKTNWGVIFACCRQAQSKTGEGNYCA